MGTKIIYVKFQASLLCIRPTTKHLKYTKEILKNSKEKSGIRIFQFLSLTTMLWDIYDGWLHSWGPNASFDTHIVIHTFGVWQRTIHVIYVIFDIYDIWHLTCTYIAIWVSKEALGSQECSQPSKIIYKIVFRANNRNILFPDFYII